MHYREIALLNDLVGLLVVFGPPSEEGDDPQVQDDLEEKALHVNSAIHVITCIMYT